MARKRATKKRTVAKREVGARARAARPSALLDTRIVYCGDCVDQLAKLPDGCVDLIYIDPPFNSNRNYEVFWGETKEKRAFEDRHASTQAYIDYMRPRCVELSRVLKKTGSFYYHCDWHASHYVKVMLDQIFRENSFQNEIVWKRRVGMSSAVHGSNRFGICTDYLMFYVNGPSGERRATFHPQYNLNDPDYQRYIEKRFTLVDETGRRFQATSLVNPANRPNLKYEYKGFKPPPNGWMISKDKMEEWDRQGKIYFPKNPDGRLRRKSYADELKGMPVQNLWTDIPEINSQAAERLGYPTQKPLALLERIVNASSNPNDIVLDAFCGCGTALVAAQNLDRQWIGIDISPTACRVMAKRLRDVCKLREDEALWRAGRGFVVRDLPWTLKKLRALPHFEFENWAVIALGGIPNKVQVGDMGIDGRIFPVGTKPYDAETKEGQTASMFAGDWFPIQVKQVDKVGRPDIDQFEAVMTREDRQRGFFVAFGYTADAEQECAAFHKNSGRIIKLITVQEILDEQHVQNM